MSSASNTDGLKIFTVVIALMVLIPVVVLSCMTCYVIFVEKFTSQVECSETDDPKTDEFVEDTSTINGSIFSEAEAEHRIDILENSEN